MGTRITLTLSDATYRQALEAAKQARRPVPELLTEALEHAFPSVFISPDRQTMEREQAAFEELLPELLDTHEGQFVAIQGGEVVDTDGDELILTRRIAEVYADEVVHIRRVSRDREPELVFRSPRLAD